MNKPVCKNGINRFNRSNQPTDQVSDHPNQPTQPHHETKLIPMTKIKYEILHSFIPLARDNPRRPSPPIDQPTNRPTNPNHSIVYRTNQNIFISTHSCTSALASQLTPVEYATLPSPYCLQTTLLLLCLRLQVRGVMHDT